MTQKSKANVSMWFDPVCPWAWLASRWLLEVEKVRDVEVTWRLMSLQVLNEPKLDELPQRYREVVETGEWWKPVRIVAAAEKQFGPDVVGPLYTALGTRFHNRGLDRSAEVFADALEAAGLPRELVDAADSTEYDDAVRASHDAGIGLVGQEVGTPVIAAPGPEGEQVAFFGPVVTPAPKGEAAGRLWDGVMLVAGTDGFFELKRTRTREAIFD
ncbi:MAG: DsbA family protein [Stackebrandtia sp.]